MSELISSYVGMWSRSFQFSGRTKRIDYWSFFIINVIIGFIFDYLNNGLYLAFVITSFIPGISAAVRRIRDTNHNPWLILVPIVSLVLLLKPRKEEVEISVKIYTNNFPEVPWNMKATSRQVVKFLLGDCGFAFTNLGIGEYVKGDKKIWYLGLAEKFGRLKYKDQVWGWNFGESSFTQVIKFIREMYEDEFLTERQMRKLIHAVSEAVPIEDIYSIGDYLQIKTKKFAV